MNLSSGGDAPPIRSGHTQHEPSPATKPVTSRGCYATVGRSTLPQRSNPRSGKIRAGDRHPGSLGATVRGTDTACHGKPPAGRDCRSSVTWPASKRLARAHQCGDRKFDRQHQAPRAVYRRAPETGTHHHKRTSAISNRVRLGTEYRFGRGGH